MQATPESIAALVEQLQALPLASGRHSLPPRPPLPPERGGGTSGGMEARLAVLEADMKHVKEQLGKLSAVPSDLATLKERATHLPTKAEMNTAITDIVDKAAGRTQRTIGIVGGLVAIAVAAINFIPKLIGHG